jgi:hypothetical protein
MTLTAAGPWDPYPMWWETNKYIEVLNPMRRVCESSPADFYEVTRMIQRGSKTVIDEAKP